MSASQNQMLDAFAQMTEAVRKVPEMEAEIERLKRDLDFCIKERDVAKTHQEDLAYRNDELAGKVSSLEVERDEYGFRNLELSDKLEKVYSLAGSLLAQAKPPVEPVKEPSAVGESAGQTATSENHSATTASPTEAVSGDQSTSGSQTNSGQPDSPSADGQREAGPTVTAISEPAHTNTTGVSNTENVSPISTTEPSQDGNAASDLPNAGRPYWFKPTTMTWLEWTNSGGELPGWVANLDSVS